MSQESVSTRRNVIAGLWFALLATLILRESLLPSHTLLPLDLIQTIAPWDALELGPLENPLISDPFYSFYPRRVLLTDSIQNGEFPLWNPYIMSGTPNTANPNFQLFYLPNLLAALVLPPDQALPWLAWGHLILTGVLMYLFLQRHRLHWYASVAGATVWLLNGYSLVWLENPHRLSTTAWLPGMFWALETAVQRKSIAWAAGGGLMLGLSILGGQMQFVFAIGIILAVYGLLTLVNTFFRDRASVGRVAAYLAVMAVIGLGIGSLIILPANQLADVSQRAQFNSETIGWTRWPRQHLVTLFAPDFYGNPVGPYRYWGPRNYVESTGYFGAAAFFLALTAPFMAVMRRRFSSYAIIVAIVSLAIVLGSPLARLITWLPGAQFIVLSRLLFLITLAGAWLTAVALDGWLEQSASARRRQLAVLLALGLITALVLWVIAQLGGQQFEKHQVSILADLRRGFWLVTAVILLLALIPRLPHVAGALIIVVIALDLVQWGWDFNPITSTDYLYPDNGVTQYLAQDTGLYRVLPLQSEKIVFGPNLLSLYGVQAVGGYTPLIFANYQELFKSIDAEDDFNWMNRNQNMLVMSHFDPIVSLLNVKYVLSAKPLPYDIVPQATQTGCAETAVLSATPLTQSFTASDPGLNRLDLRFATAGSAADETVEFWLWRDQVEGELVAHSTIPAGDLLTDLAQPFFFAPVPDSAHQTFVWGVRSSATETAVALCQNSAGQYAFAAYATWLQQKEAVDGIWIYENPNVAPRAFMVHHVQQAAEDQVLDALHAPAFNWYHSAIMAAPLPPEQQAQLSDQPIRSPGSVTITNYQAQQIDIQVETAVAGLLVLSDSYYPGWKARIDGEETPIYRVNHALRGLFVPPGAHEISFQFQPQILQTAVIVATISFILAVTLIIQENYRRKQTPS